MREKFWVTGWILVTLAVVAGLTSVIMEAYAHEEIWMITMKLSSLAFGAGGIMVGLSRK